MMEERLNTKICVENDANAAALGEYLAGSAKGAKNAIAITLGTGIGGGIIINGKIYSGSNYAGAELGHMVIVKDGKECACGRKGCWEAYASATGLINLTKQEILKENFDFSYMLKSCDGDINKVTGKTAFDAVLAGDANAKTVIDEYIGYLACGLVNIINISSRISFVSAAVFQIRARIFLLRSVRLLKRKDIQSITISRQSSARQALAMMQALSVRLFLNN